MPEFNRPLVEIERVRDIASLATASATTVADRVLAVLGQRSRCVLAVPGGSTARIVLPRLAELSLPWNDIIVTLTDERWVPLEHSDSNEALVRRCLAPVPVRVIGLSTGAPRPEDAMQDLEARIPTPDVVLLGMGEDGHIASLFPGDAANVATGKLTVVHRPDHVRVTLTPAAIAKAHIVLAFTGAAKAAVFNRALAAGPTAELPVRHVLRSGTEVFIGP